MEDNYPVHPRREKMRETDLAELWSTPDDPRIYYPNAQQKEQPKAQHEPGPILWGCSGVIVATALGITLVLWGIGRFL